jgi:hypothetical protein
MATPPSPAGDPLPPASSLNTPPPAADLTELFAGPRRRREQQRRQAADWYDWHNRRAKLVQLLPPYPPEPPRTEEARARQIAAGLGAFCKALEEQGRLGLLRDLAPRVNREQHPERLLALTWLLIEDEGERARCLLEPPGGAEKEDVGRALDWLGEHRWLDNRCARGFWDAFLPLLDKADPEPAGGPTSEAEAKATEANARGQTDTRADTKKKKQMPEARDKARLIRIRKAIQKGVKEGKSMLDCARESTEHNEKEAQSLLRFYRNHTPPEDRPKAP